MFGIFGKTKEISLKKNEDVDVKETETELLNKFKESVYCGLIEETKFDEFDFYEIYDKTKNYELDKYNKIYKDNMERTYKNIVYEGYILKNSEIQEYSEDSKEYYKNKSDEKKDKQIVNENNKIRVVYIVAKEIYDEDELKLLEPYCTCINCENDKKRLIMPYYKKINDEFIFSLIRLITYFFGQWNSYTFTSYLKQFLNICSACPCCCGCIKSRHNTSANSVKLARILYLKIKNYELMNNFKIEKEDDSEDIEYLEDIYETNNNITK